MIVSPRWKGKMPDTVHWGSLERGPRIHDDSLIFPKPMVGMSARSRCPCHSALPFVSSLGLALGSSMKGRAKPKNPVDEE